MNYIVVNGAVIPTEIVLTEKEQCLGLMFRKEAVPMSFPYTETNIKKFWMKNTYCPLDIIFCRNNKVISIEAGIPLSLQEVGPDEDVDLVVELPRGSAAKLGIRKGSDLKLNYDLETLAKKFNLKLQATTL